MYGGVYRLITEMCVIIDVIWFYNMDRLNGQLKCYSQGGRDFNVNYCKMDQLDGRLKCQFSGGMKLNKPYEMSSDLCFCVIGMCSVSSVVLGLALPQQP